MIYVNAPFIRVTWRVYSTDAANYGQGTSENLPICFVVTITVNVFFTTV